MESWDTNLESENAKQGFLSIFMVKTRWWLNKLWNNDFLTKYNLQIFARDFINLK